MAIKLSLSQPDDIDRVYDAHEKYRETALFHRRFKQKDIIPLIERRRHQPAYQIESIGTSFEGRDIKMIKTGTGARKVLLWTQMHGDEPTATMACFDILNFLEGGDDGLDDFRTNILSNTTLYFVPMLNPDGAERYQRRNAQEIDINRDALALQAPESRILKGLQQSLKPEFGFNLHDKNPRYSVGNTSKLATMSFLATAYDEGKSINPVREKSMQLITVMNRAVQKYIPEQVGKWNEDFEPRAFGDNIQKWGTTLILVESGGYAGDPEKQFIRKLNFVAILTGLDSIAKNSFVNEGLSEYRALPENSRYIFDLLIKNVTVEKDGKKFKTDIGIDRHEINMDRATSFFYKSTIEDCGDLSIFSGTEELDADGLGIRPGRTLPLPYKDPTIMDPEKAWSLLKEGYTYRLTDEAQNGMLPAATPLHFIGKKKAISPIPAPDDIATFILTKNGKARYAVVNGFVHDVEKPFDRKGNGLIE